MQYTMRYFLSALALLSVTFSAAQTRPLPWTKNAVIYEVNTRQYSPRGTFREVEMSLTRLKNLGIDMLWLMPVHPIGELNRKGGLGSYYSVKDYKGIDPSYGDTADFRRLVTRAHAMGFKVIIDWVANHTAWDHAWARQHPDWYIRNEKGEIQSQFDWSDVAKLNFENQAMRAAMIEDMKYWVREFDIDGFRCDVAFLVPVDFWENARTELEKIKPLFMLAEMEWNTEITQTPEVYFNKAFNASYGWNFMGVTQDMAAGKKTLSDFRSEMRTNYARFPKDMLKLLFVTNHDENSWNGTVTEKYASNWKLYAALCYTLPQSLPLMYTGEEAGLNRRLQFFEKDPVMPHEWADTSRYAWYRSVIALRHQNPALWNSGNPELFSEIPVKSADTAISNKVYAFKRTSGKHEVAVISNFSKGEVVFDFVQWKPDASYKVLFDSKALYKGKDGKWILKPNEIVIFHK
jgi:glycosidase